MATITLVVQVNDHFRAFLLRIISNGYKAWIIYYEKRRLVSLTPLIRLMQCIGMNFDGQFNSSKMQIASIWMLCALNIVCHDTLRCSETVVRLSDRWRGLFGASFART